MLTGEMRDIIRKSKKNGWVMEPEAKRILSLAGMDVPNFRWAKEAEEAEKYALEIGYPVVAKIVSPKWIHKSDAGGVVVGIQDAAMLGRTFSRFQHLEGFSGMLIEEMITGLELILGANIDYQFGPVILLGIGGTGVEIYRDTSLRMAPLRKEDVKSMVKGLKAHRLLEGYRGNDPVNMEELGRLMITFSELVMDLENDIDSIDLNPVVCSSHRCVVADARIMLKKENA